MRVPSHKRARGRPDGGRRVAIANEAAPNPETDHESDCNNPRRRAHWRLRPCGARRSGRSAGAERAREVRPAKRAAVNRRVAQRPIFRNEAAATYAPAVGYYAGPPPAQKPYGGPGRAQFEPLVIGAAPERGETRSPEGP